MLVEQNFTSRVSKKSSSRFMRVNWSAKVLSEGTSRTGQLVCISNELKRDKPTQFRWPFIWFLWSLGPFETECVWHRKLRHLHKVISVSHMLSQLGTLSQEAQQSMFSEERLRQFSLVSWGASSIWTLPLTVKSSTSCSNFAKVVISFRDIAPSSHSVLLKGLYCATCKWQKQCWAKSCFSFGTV